MNKTMTKWEFLHFAFVALVCIGLVIGVMYVANNLL